MSEQLWTDERIRSVIKRFTDPADVAIAVRDDYQHRLSLLETGEQWPSGYPERVRELLGELAAAQERIKVLEQQVAQQGEWMPVEDGELDKLGTVLRNRTIFVKCSLHNGVLHGYTLQDDEYLVRRKEQPHD